jgi:hypothetical protein
LRPSRKERLPLSGTSQSGSSWRMVRVFAQTLFGPGEASSTPRSLGSCESCLAASWCMRFIVPTVYLIKVLFRCEGPAGLPRPGPSGSLALAVESVPVVKT